jgi:two-component system chemotaxis response regulator CheB
MIVQHITSGFASDFATRLASSTGLRLSQMKNDEKLQHGTMYIALGDYHIGVKQFGSDLRLKISQDVPINSHRPSVDFLFGSASFARRKVFAALLTGMGKDGATGLLQLKDKGAYTSAQSEESCVVFGMPKEAIKLNAAGFVGDPNQIRERLNHLLSFNQHQGVDPTDLLAVPRKIG